MSVMFTWKAGKDRKHLANLECECRTRGTMRRLFAKGKRDKVINSAEMYRQMWEITR